MAEESGPTVYSVRFTEYARREIDAIISALEGRDAATAWYQGFLAIIGGLATNPRRFAVQQNESRKLGDEVRRELYRQTPGSSAVYSVFYFIQDASDDGPVVTIVHLRHASRKPITHAEAKDIRAGQ